MMDKITCPNCSHKIDIEDALAKDLEKSFENKLELERQKLRDEERRRLQQFELVKKTFEDHKMRENEEFAKRLKKAVKDQEENIKRKLDDEFDIKIKSQNTALEDSRKKIRELMHKEEELLKMQRKMDGQIKEREIVLQRKLLEERSKMEEEVARQLRSEVELQLIEKDKKLADQHRLIKELKRKSEQGSMQMQGEVQELAIEEHLKINFPFDKIEEVPKGLQGADTIHTVVNQLQQDCGKIIYESKRTKAFSNEWVDKLKVDQRKVQADVAVIVTQTMPRGMERFGQINGIWVCSFEEFKGLIFVLRSFIIRLASARSTNENKGDKMEVLYNFLTSEEFKLQMGGIVDGFQNLKNDLEKEKMAMRKIWKQREKQLELVIGNTVDMYGSIKGIAGAAIPTIEQLELPEPENSQTSLDLGE